MAVIKTRQLSKQDIPGWQNNLILASHQHLPLVALTIRSMPYRLQKGVTKQKVMNDYEDEFEISMSYSPYPCCCSYP